MLLRKRSRSIRKAAALCGPPQYRNETHERLPHIVKFSGGRSSASMLLSLARNGLLDAERNDAVLFANTSAEHPGTYEFARKVCDEIEVKHGIPCFWYEFCSVETPGRRGEWTRSDSYRLVKRDCEWNAGDPLERPGHRRDGSVFEEFVSREVMLPNRHLRVCTQKLSATRGC